MLHTDSYLLHPIPENYVNYNRSSHVLVFNCQFMIYDPGNPLCIEYAEYLANKWEMYYKQIWYAQN